jgi:phosphopantetheine adenylyltransferase
MRILILGDPLLNAHFRALGCEVFNVGDKEACDVRCPQALSALEIFDTVRSRSLAPDVVLCCLSGAMPRFFDLEKLPCPIVLYTTSCSCKPWHLFLAHAFDRVFVAQKAYVELFTRKGLPASWLPLCSGAAADIVSVMEALLHKSPHLARLRPEELPRRSALLANAYRMLASAPEQAQDVSAEDDFFAHEHARLAKLYPHIPHFSREYIEKVRRSQGFVFKDGAYVHADMHNEYINITQGFRETTDQPATSANTLYILGPSVAFGVNSEDSDTIASYLQRLMNQEMPGKFSVVSKAVRACNYSNAVLIFSNLPLQHGDVVILLSCTHRDEEFLTDEARGLLLRHIHDACKTAGCFFAFFARPDARENPNPSDDERFAARGELGKLASLPPVSFAEKYVPPQLVDIVTALGCPAYDLQPYFNRPHALGEVFVDRNHLGPRGNEEIARRIHEKIVRHILLQPQSAETSMNASIAYLKLIAQKHYGNNTEIVAWIHRSREKKFTGKERIGAVVVNCNPFTRGHLHLIEEAAARVDGLYIFVVEEDRSIFSFTDRFQMVFAGVRHLRDKVRVVPSGKFIISAFSFPEYFDKERAQTSVDTSQDVILFGALIAPGLNITQRFVGDELDCVITAGYNESMQRLLPPMGVAVHVVPRATRNGHPISASRVRSLMQAGDLEGVKELVPASTYRHLTQAGFLPAAQQEIDAMSLGKSCPETVAIVA